MRPWFGTGKIIAWGVGLWVLTSPVCGQDAGPPVPPKAPPYPHWMEKATMAPTHSPAAVAGAGGMTEPVEPVDPDPNGSLRPVQGPSGKSRFQFTPPKMPDLKNLRRKATRVTIQRTASGSEMTAVETFDCSDLEGERRKITQLEAAIQALPVGPLRSALEERLADQRRRVAAAEELSRLLPPSAPMRQAAGGAEQKGASVAAPSHPSGKGAGLSGDGPAATPMAGTAGPGSAVASSAAAAAPGMAGGPGGAPTGDGLLTASMPAGLSPAQRRRVDELRRVLWTPPRPPVPPAPPVSSPPSPGVGPVPATAPPPAAVASPPVVRIPEQFYRPEGRKSFYQEMKEAREVGAEEDETAGGGTPAAAAADAHAAADAAAAADATASPSPQKAP